MFPSGMIRHNTSSRQHTPAANTPLRPACYHTSSSILQFPLGLLSILGLYPTTPQLLCREGWEEMLAVLTYQLDMVMRSYTASFSG